MKEGSGIMRALAAVGALALLALLAAGVAGAVAVRRGFSAHDEPSALEAWVARAARSLAVPAHVQALKNPVAETPETHAEARAHWADHCASCHANDGSGQTSLGQGLYPKAPDMRAEATQRLSDGELYGIIQNGIRLTGMPAWGQPDDLANRDSWTLVHFIRRLPRLPREELEMMKSLNPQSRHELLERQQEEEFLNEAQD